MISENTIYIIRKTFKKLLPPMISTAFASRFTSSMVDFIFVSVFCGSGGLTILALFLPISFIWDIVEDMFASGGTTLFAIAKGEKNHEKEQTIFEQSLTFVLLICILMAIIAFTAFPHLVIRWNYERDLAGAAIQYAKIFGIAYGANVCGNVCRNFVNSDSAPGHAMIIGGIKMTLNVLFELLYIGILRCGIVGTLYALISSNAVSIIMSAIYYSSARTKLRLRFSPMTPENFMAVLKLSYCKLFEDVGVATVGVFYNYILLSRFGSSAVVIQCALLTIYTVIWGIGEPVIFAGDQIVGLFGSEKDNDGIRVTLKYELVINAVTGLVIMALLMAFPIAVARCLALELPADIGSWTTAVRFFALSLAPSFLNLTIMSYYQTIGRIRITFQTSLLRSFILPIAIGLVLMQFRIQNIMWLYYLLTELGCAAAFALTVRHTARKTKADSLLLLDDSEQLGIMRYDFIMKYPDPDAESYLEMAEMFLHKQYDIEEERIERILEACRMIYRYSVTQSTEKPQVSYIRLELSSHWNLLVAARWIGNANRQGRSASEIRRMQDLADDYVTDSIYGFNYLGLHFYKTLADYYNDKE